MNVLGIINSVKETYVDTSKFDEDAVVTLLDKEKFSFHAYLIGKIMGVVIYLIIIPFNLLVVLKVI